MERSLRIAQMRLEPDHPRLAVVLLVYADLLVGADEPSRAAEYFDRAGAILEKKFGPKQSDLAWSLAGAGLARMRLGDFAGARAPLERSLRMREEIWGLEGGDVVYSLVGVADLYRSVGESDAAIPLLKRSLVIRERTSGKKSPEAIAFICELANAYLEAGNTAEAKRLFAEGLNRVEATRGRQSSLALGPVMGLACIARIQKQDSLAFSEFQRALRILEKTRDPQDSDVGWVLANLASLSLDRGEIALALSFSERGIGIYRKAFGTTHPSWAWMLALRAQVLHAAGRDRESLRASLESESVARDHLKLTIRSMSEREALRFASVRTSGMDLTLEIACSPRAPDNAATESWDALVRARSLVLDEIAARRSRSGSDSLWRAYSASRQRIANLIVRGARDERMDHYRESLSQARDQSEKLERLLAEANPSFREERRRDRAGLAEVLAALPEQSALVSYARYSTGKGRDGAGGRDRYMAFVYRSGAEPLALRIGAAASIDRLVERWRREVVRPGLEGAGPSGSVSDYRAVASELRRAVWDPVAPHVRTARFLFIVPDGLLNLVSFAALPWQQSSYLAEAGLAIHYASAERDLLQWDDSLAPGRGLLALGDPDFDADPGFRSLNVALTSASSDSGAHAYRGQTAGCSELVRMKWHRLPATGTEVTELVAAWTGGASGDSSEGVESEPSVMLRGGDATEYAFKRWAPGRRVLHVATHGFVLGKSCEPGKVGARGIAGFMARPGGDPLSQGPVGGSLLGGNPFLLSGLVLAGANRRQSPCGDCEDGILTAEEIGALNLSGVEWAVLSACESGVGAVRWREGVFGLRRAFRAAGASTLITSLWPVEDSAARSWMRALYESRFIRRMSTASSVREATLDALRDRRARGVSTHPFYWASFVAAGDWR
jgi:tetratricopeptide (TPR) repeat protein